MKRAIIFVLVFSLCGSGVVRAQAPVAPITDPRVRLATLLSPLPGEPAEASPPKPIPDLRPPAATPEPPPAIPPIPLIRNPLEELLNLKPTIQMRGRIEAEAVIAAQSQASKDTIGDLQNGYGFRRVRLGAQGTIGDSASWVSEVELAGGSVRLRDVFVGLDAIPGVRQIRVGYFREPYSLEGMTSSNFITFLERSSLNVLSPTRNWGVCGY